MENGKRRKIKDIPERKKNIMYVFRYKILGMDLDLINIFRSFVFVIENSLYVYTFLIENLVTKLEI